MEGPRRLHLSLVLEPDREPIRGALETRRGERHEFEGWIELAAALEALMHPDGSTGDRPVDER